MNHFGFYIGVTGVMKEGAKELREENKRECCSENGIESSVKGFDLI